MKAPLFFVFWLFHFLCSAFLLICEIELVYGVASEFNDPLTTGQKTGHILFEIFGFPLLSFFWDQPFFEGTKIYCLVAGNSFLWTVTILFLWNFWRQHAIKLKTSTP